MQKVKMLPVKWNVSLTCATGKEILALSLSEMCGGFISSMSGG